MNETLSNDTSAVAAKSVVRGEGGAPPLSARLIAGYLLMVLAGVLLFLLIRHVGTERAGVRAIPVPTASAPAQAHASAANVLPHLLLAFAAIIFLSRVVGALFQRLHQPPVMGEVLAGIFLGPSVLGRVAPEAMAFLFPPSVLPALNAIAQFGVVLFMFLIGLELNTDRLKEGLHTTLAISNASILCPFLLGSTLALYLYPRYSTPSLPFTAFALFIGVSMSVTAFPVLARILTDRRIHRSRMGVIALTCAAVGDVSAWCLLALVVGVVQAKVSSAVATAVLTVAYIALMFLVVHPVLVRYVRRHEEPSGSDQRVMATLLISLLLSCLATEYIGIHALFGAFLLGAVIPHESWAARMMTDKLHDFVVVLLLPAFFALTGLRTQIGLIDGSGWLVCLLIIFVAFAGKFGGSALAARFTGLSWRDSAGLGILMNTRGLVELIVLNVGLDLGVLTPQLFAMLVIMAIVTTFATSPILDRLIGDDWRHEEQQAEAA